MFSSNLGTTSYGMYGGYGYPSSYPPSNNNNGFGESNNNGFGGSNNNGFGGYNNNNSIGYISAYPPPNNNNNGFGGSNNNGFGGSNNDKVDWNIPSVTIPEITPRDEVIRKLNEHKKLIVKQKLAKYIYSFNDRTNVDRHEITKVNTEFIEDIVDELNNLLASHNYKVTYNDKMIIFEYVYL